jgi:hypothetical protein
MASGPFQGVGGGGGGRERERERAGGRRERERCETVHRHHAVVPSRVRASASLASNRRHAVDGPRVHSKRTPPGPFRPADGAPSPALPARSCLVLRWQQPPRSPTLKHPPRQMRIGPRLKPARCHRPSLDADLDRVQPGLIGSGHLRPSHITYIYGTTSSGRDATGHLAAATLRAPDASESPPAPGHRANR